MWLCSWVLFKSAFSEHLLVLRFNVVMRPRSNEQSDDVLCRVSIRLTIWSVSVTFALGNWKLDICFGKLDPFFCLHAACVLFALESQKVIRNVPYSGAK